MNRYDAHVQYVARMRLGAAGKADEIAHKARHRARIVAGAIELAAASLVYAVFMGIAYMIAGAL